VQQLSRSAAPAGAVKERTGHDDLDHAAIARPTTTPWQRAYDRWEVDARRRLRPGTFENYQREVRNTLAAIDKPVESIDYGDLMVHWDNRDAEWRDKWNRPLKLATYNNWVSAVQHFFAYLVEKEELPIRNPAAKLERARPQDLEIDRKVYDPIPRGAYQAMVWEAFRQEDHVWYVAARFAWTTLARIGELYELRWRDIDFDRGQVRIRRPKAGPPVEKFLYEGLLEDLAWLRDHHRAVLGTTGWKDPDVAARPEDPVFRRGDLQKAGFRAWFTRHLRKYAKAVGYEGHVHPHLVRASSATDLYERGVREKDIMDQGAWKTGAALRRYLRGNPEALRERLREGLDL
jgi:integrase